MVRNLLVSLVACFAVAFVLAPAIAAQVPAPESVPDDTPCTLCGVLVDETGAPVVGVTLSVQGWIANSDRQRRFGAPKNWQNPTPVVTDDEGRFAVTFVPPRAFQFTLDAAPAGRGKVAWRWSTIAPGAELDLGTTVLEPEALIVGHIVDGKGDLLTGGWMVMADMDVGQGIGGRSSVLTYAAVDDATGLFRVEGLPPGRVQVSATSGSIRIPNVSVTTKSGVETEVELRYDGPDPARKLVVSISTSPFHPFRLETGAVHAIAADGTRVALEREPGRANDWYVPDIAPGLYRVEVRDPRFLDWTQADVRPGQPARARLEGSAALVVRAVDGDTGARVEEFALDVGYRGVNFSPNVFRLREANATLPPQDLFRGIVPGDLTIEVVATGWPTARVDVDALTPGETREVEVRLLRARPLHGRLLDARGRPLAGVSVQATRGEYPGHDQPDGGTRTIAGGANGKSFRAEIRYRDAAVTTAEDGTFTIEGLGAGRHTLVAELGRYLDAVTQVNLPTDDVVTITAPHFHTVSLRLDLPEGTDTSTLAIEPLPEMLSEFDHLRRARRGPAERAWQPASDGKLPTERLPSGRHKLGFRRLVSDEFGSGSNGIMYHDIEIERDGEVVLDLREQFPVEVTLHITRSEGEKASRGWVMWQLLGADGQRHSVTTRSGRQGAPMFGSVYVPPGTFTLQATGSGFEWAHPEPVIVTRTERTELNVVSPVLTRNVQILDAAGAPRPNAHVAYWTARGTRAAAEADAKGVLSLTLPEGDVSLASLPPQAPAPDDELQRRLGAKRVDPQVLAAATAGATLRFGPGDGPLVARLPAP